MKTSLNTFLIVLALLSTGGAVDGQPVITFFNPDGTLICSNLSAGSTASVASAVSLAGPWQTNLAGLNALTVGTDGTIQVTLPMTNPGPVFFRVLDTTNGAACFVPAGMAAIPAGSFMMGDCLDGETDAVPTCIYVSQFFMDTNVVTYGLWEAVYTNSISQGYGFDYGGSGKALNQPAETVDWWDCVKWCNARSQQEGLTPAYYTDADFTQVYTNGQLSPAVNWSANGYRLPTEAEWEKAARGGLSGQRFPGGNTISESQANYYADPSDYPYDLGPYAGFNANFFDGTDYPYTSPVGYFAPNGYGLYDMAGNVFQWCWDFYGSPYGQPSTNNPTGAVDGRFRTYRGSSWISYAYSARCAKRNWTDDPLDADWYQGFRCVRGH